MNKLITAVIALILFGTYAKAEEMPGTSIKVTATVGVSVSLKDEIAFEKEKLVTYGDAIQASKGNRLPIVTLVGCYVDDIQLFLSLKGKVILCYLPSKATPFTTLESGVVVGLWNADGSTCVRHDVAAITFSDPKFRDSLLFNKNLPVQTETVVETFVKRGNTYYSTTTGLPANFTTNEMVQTGGLDCSNGQCRPTYAPSTPSGRTGPFGRPK